MNKYLLVKHRLDNNNTHLLNIFDESFFLKVGVVNPQILRKLLALKVVKLKDLIYPKIYENESFINRLVYFQNLSKNNKAIQLYLTYGLLVWKDQNSYQQFSPLCLIPIQLNFQDDGVYINQTSSVIENFTLIETLIKSNKDFHPLNERLNCIYSLDKYILNFTRNSEFKVHLDSYFTFGYLDHQQIVLDHHKFMIDKNITNKIDQQLSFNHDGFGINLFNLNLVQKNILAQAVAGNSFAIDGILGTGKTTTLVNVALDALYRGKKVLYISNIFQTLEQVENLTKDFRIDNLICNLTKYGFAPYKTVTKLNKTEVDLSPQEESLKHNYQFIEDVEKAIFSRIRNNRLLDCMNYLASLKEEHQLLDLKCTNRLYKHEFEEIYFALGKIEKYLGRFPSFKNSIWQKIPYDHTIKYPNQVITLIYKMHKHYRTLNIISDELQQNFGLQPFTSYIKMRELINIFDTYNTAKYPENWYEGNFEKFYQALDLFSNFKKQYDEYHTIYNDLKYLYSVDVINIDLDNIINKLLGSYFTTQDERSINRIIDNRLNLLMQIKRSNEIIESFEKVISEVKKKLNYNFESTEEVFIDLDNLYLFVSENAYHPNWLKINTLHKLYRLIEEVKSITYQIKKFEEFEAEFGTKYPKTFLKDIEKEYDIIAKYLQKERLTLREKSIISKYKNYSYQEVYWDFRHYINQNMQAEALKKRYLELTEFNYTKDANIIEGLENLYQLQQNLHYPEHLKLFKDHLRTRTQKTNLIFGQANPLKDFSQSYRFINKYRENLVQCGFVIEGDFIKSLTEISKINDFLVNFYTTYDDFLASTHLQHKQIYLADLLKLKQMSAKVFALKDEFKKEKYYEVFGELYEKEKTNILKLQNSLKSFSNFLNSFSKLEYASKFLQPETKEQLTIQLDNIVKEIEEIDELIKLYIKLFVDRISVYYYDNFEDVVNQLEKFLSSKDELVLYLNITEHIKTLKKHQVQKLIDYALDEEKGQGISENFKYTYYHHLWEEFQTLYPYINLTSIIEQSLQNIISLEKQIIIGNIVKVSQKINYQYAGTKNISKKDLFAYDSFLEKISTYKRLVLSSTRYANYYLDIRDFDLIIIDDAHIGYADLYHYVIKGKQVVIAGNSEHSSLVKMNLISQVPKDSIIYLTHRYLPIPKNIFDIRENLTSLIPNEYFQNQGIEITNENIVRFIYKKLIENINYKFNVFIRSLSEQRLLIEQLIHELTTHGYSFPTCYELIMKNINIVDLEERLIIDADYNVLLVKDYNQADVEANVDRMICDLFTVKQKVILVDDEKLLEQETNSKFFKKLQGEINELEISYNEHILQIDLIEKLKEQFSRYNISLIGSYHDLSLILLSENRLYGCIIYWDINKINYQTLEQYRNFYEHYRQNNWKVYLIWIVDLVNNFYETIKKISEEIGGE